MSRKRKEERGEYNFFDWIDQVNNANKENTQFGRVAPSTTFKKMERKALKDLTYRNVFYRLYNILLKMFVWTAPKTINSRIIEQAYIDKGQLSLFKGKFGLLCLPCLPNNYYNVYGDPTSVNVYGYNGYTDTVSIIYEEEIPTAINYNYLTQTNNIGIYSRDNDLNYAYINYIKEYSLKIADKMIAFDIATNKLKNPYFFTVDDIQLKENAEKIQEKIQDNDDIIIQVRSNKLNGGDNTGIVEHNISTPAQNIDSLKNAILFDFNMFLETIGINTNPSPDKTQVVLTPEINSNNGIIGLEQDIRFLNRQKFCEDAKKILGVDLKVEKNKNIDLDIKNIMNDFMGGEGVNGKENKNNSTSNDEGETKNKR